MRLFKRKKKEEPKWEFKKEYEAEPIKEEVVVEFLCPHCGKRLKTERGRNIHVSRMHPEGHPTE